jgi:hypothetical protein
MLREPVIINHTDSYVIYLVESFLLFVRSRSHHGQTQDIVVTLHTSFCLRNYLLNLFEDEATSSNAVAATIGGGGGGGGPAAAAIGLLRDDDIIH